MGLYLLYIYSAETTDNNYKLKSTLARSKLLDKWFRIKFLIPNNVIKKTFYMYRYIQTNHLEIEAKALIRVNLKIY